MATGTFTAQFLAHENPKKLIKTHRKVLKTSNLAYTMLLVQGRISQKYGFQMCLLAMLGLQGIVYRRHLFSYGGLSHSNKGEMIYFFYVTAVRKK